MAQVRIEGDDLVVALSGWEKLGALHSDVRVPRRCVRSARTVPDAMAEVRGLRAPGTGWPGAIGLGTWRHRGGKDFVAVYRHRPGIVIELDGAAFARLVITADDAGRLASELAARV
jgi:hypothetical protein